MGSTRARRIPQPEGPDDLLPATDAMRRLQVGRTTLSLLTRSGELPCVRIGRAVRFRASDLDAFVASRVEGG